MSMIEPIKKLADINDDDCLAGYRAGLGFTSVDYTQKSASYWHGHHNGQADRGLVPVSAEACALVREFIGESRRKAMN